MNNELILNGKVCKNIDTHDGKNTLFDCGNSIIAEIFLDTPLGIQHGAYVKATKENLPYGLSLEKKELDNAFFREASTYAGSTNNLVSKDIVLISYEKSKYDDTYSLFEARGTRGGWQMVRTLKRQIPTEQQAKKEIHHYMTYH
jgi:hypothetical protein